MNDATYRQVIIHDPKERGLGMKVPIVGEDLYRRMKVQLKKLIPSPRWRDFLGLVVSTVFLWASLRQTSDDLWEVRLSWQQWCF